MLHLESIDLAKSRRLFKVCGRLTHLFRVATPWHLLLLKSCGALNELVWHSALLQTTCCVSNVAWMACRKNLSHFCHFSKILHLLKRISWFPAYFQIFTHSAPCRSRFWHSLPILGTILGSLRCSFPCKQLSWNSLYVHLQLFGRNSVVDSSLWSDTSLVLKQLVLLVWLTRLHKFVIFYWQMLHRHILG